MGTELNFGTVLKTPEVSLDVGTNTYTTLISETKTLAPTDEKHVDEVATVAYNKPTDQPK